MACRRLILKQGTLLRRWYHPSLSHIVHPGDENEDNFQSPTLSQYRCGSSNFVLPQTHYGSSFGVHGGFEALSGQSKCFPAFFLPVGVGSSLYRYMSSATGEGSDNVDRLGDIADLITDETMEAVTSQAPENEVAVAAADSALPVAALQHLIDFLHSVTGLNWWAAIALTTIIIRGATLPFLINQLKATYKLNLIRPRMEEIKLRVQASGMDPTAVAEGQKEMNALLKQYGVGPFTPLKGLLIQGPIFISFFFAITNMVEKVPSMKNGGALWFTDLTTPDSLFIFPVLASLSFLVLVEFNMQEGFEGSPVASNMKKASRIFAILAVPFTMGFPKALFCYWISSNLFSLSYGLGEFGPVNLFWSTRYDKAMTLFLTCLKDFSEFARMKDLENNIPPDKCFKLPYRIENDKVEAYSITQSFNKPENWTKALKYTLCNLKWALYWFVGNTSFQPLSASSQADAPAAGTSYVKRSTNSKSDSRSQNDQ